MLFRSANGSNNTPTKDPSSAPVNGAPNSTAQPAAPALLTAPTEPPIDQRVEKLKQRVTVTKDGKKRIAPMLIQSSSGLGESSLPQTKLISSAAQAAGRSDNPHNILDISKPYDGFPKGGLPALLVGNKRKYAEIEGDEDRQVERRLAGAAHNGGAAIVLNSEKGLIPPAAAAPNTGDRKSVV